MDALLRIASYYREDPEVEWYDIAASALLAAFAVAVFFTGVRNFI